MADQDPHSIDRFARLPAGRHGLPADLVASNQRERIIAAVVGLVATTGYPAVTLEDIVGQASVSRRTFYEHFSGKEEAFLAAYDTAAADLARRIQAGVETGDTFAERTWNALEAAIDYVVAEPALAMVCLVEIAAVGTAGIDRRNEAIRRFVTMLDRVAADAPGSAVSPPELTTMTVVGGLNEVFYSRLVRGASDELPGLLPDLVYSVLLPFVGRDEALAEYRALLDRAAVA
ncbi:MAG: TetR/AcrR family transcriptional regulator [Solirubrobacteraceae bacterium]